MKDKSKPVCVKETFSLWFKVVVACIPGAIVTLLFDDYITAHFETPYVIAGALIFYGIVLSSWNAGTRRGHRRWRSWKISHIRLRF